MNYKSFKHVWCVLLCLSAFASSSAHIGFRSGVNAFRGWLGGLVLIGQKRIYRDELKALRSLNDDDRHGEPLVQFENIIQGLRGPKFLENMQLELMQLKLMYNTMQRKPLCLDASYCTYTVSDDGVNFTGKHTSECRSYGDLDKVFTILSNFFRCRQNRQNGAPLVSCGRQREYLQRVQNDREDKNENTQRNETIQRLIDKRNDDYDAEYSFYQGTDDPDYKANCDQWVSTEEKYGNEVNNNDYDRYSDERMEIFNNNHRKWNKGNQMREYYMNLDRGLSDDKRRFAHLDHRSDQDETSTKGQCTLENYKYHAYGRSMVDVDTHEGVKARLYRRIKDCEEGKIINDKGEGITSGQLEDWFAAKKAEDARRLTEVDR